jgi:hypothetical protein
MRTALGSGRPSLGSIPELIPIVTNPTNRIIQKIKCSLRYRFERRKDQNPHASQTEALRHPRDYQTG